MSESNCYRRGTGPPLLLLHSLGQRWQMWGPVLDELSEHHEVVAVDLPRFGRAPRARVVTEESIRLYGVRSLERLFAQLDLDRPHVAGLGLGGMLAAIGACRGIVASATAFSPTGFWSPLQAQYVAAHLRLFRWCCRRALATTPPLAYRRPIRTALLSRLCHHPHKLSLDEGLDHIAGMRDAPAFDEAIRSTRQFVWRTARAPTVPLTVAWAQYDRMLNPRQARRAAQRLPGAHLVALPDCGHLAIADDPSLVVRTILSTIARAAEC
jgi:pimeloyl-ACP methyl ester carboxylesterase